MSFAGKWMEIIMLSETSLKCNFCMFFFLHWDLKLQQRHGSEGKVLGKRKGTNRKKCV
jgi:hypothetical protein